MGYKPRKSYYAEATICHDQSRLQGFFYATVELKTYGEYNFSKPSKTEWFEINLNGAGSNKERKRVLRELRHKGADNPGLEVRVDI